MCGIVGIRRPEPVAAQLVDALKRLEYRGYDSAGVATLEHGALTRRRAEGKLEAILEARLASRAAQGHHRHRPHPLGHPWRVRPRPTRIRTPPTGVAVVHNGIIENFLELRDELAAEGASFVTETDTEVVAHLVSQRDRSEAPHRSKRSGGAAAAARRLCAGVPVRRRGRSSDRRAQGLAARRRLRRRRDVLGSDAIALAPFTDTITYLEDGDWVVVTRDSVPRSTTPGQPVVSAPS